jgi:hypothetical protein
MIQKGRIVHAHEQVNTTTYTTDSSDKSADLLVIRRDGNWTAYPMSLIESTKHQIDGYNGVKMWGTFGGSFLKCELSQELIPIHDKIELHR